MLSINSNWIRLPVFIIFLLCSSVSAIASTDNQDEHTLIVHVNKVRSNDGKIVALLFNSDKGYPGDHKQAYKTAFVPIENGSAVLKFEGLPKDNFVVSLFHDEDDDDELDRKWYGGPKEGVGVSNNVKGGFGPPDYEKSQVKISELQHEIDIEMFYP